MRVGAIPPKTVNNAQIAKSGTKRSASSDFCRKSPLLENDYWQDCRNNNLCYLGG